jgi:hypothetical protein
MALAEETRSSIRTIAGYAVGVLGLALFVWTPSTPRGMIICAALLGVFWLGVILVTRKKPGKSQ